MSPGDATPPCSFLHQPLAQRGKLSTAELVRLRVRYFSDGAVLDSRTFVEGIFETPWAQFSPKRKH